MIYSTIALACRYAGLKSPDSDDVAQDILVWLLESGRLESKACAPWLIGVAMNFIRRHRRRVSRRAASERAARCGSEQLDPDPALDALVFLDELQSRSPQRDRRLLTLMRDGWTLTEAARLTGIPEGSRQFYLRRLQARASDLADAMRRFPSMRPRVQGG